MKIKNEHIIDEIETSYDSNGAIATERILCLCGEEFDDKDEFNEHQKEELNKKLEQVQKEHLPYDYFDCNCGETFESVIDFVNHLKMEVV